MKTLLNTFIISFKNDYISLFFLTFVFFTLILFHSFNIPVYSPLLLLIGLAVVLFIFKFPKYGLYLLIVNLPLNQYIPLFGFSGDKFSISVNEIILFFLFISMVFKKLSTGKLTIPNSKLNRPILFLLAINVASLLIAMTDLSFTDYLKCWLYFLLWAEYFLIFFLIMDLVKSEKEIKIILLLMIFSAAITIFSAIQQQILGNPLHSIGIVTGSGQTYYRLVPEFGFFSNHYGAYLLVILSILTNIYFFIQKKYKFLTFLLIIPTFYTLFYTFSRGTFISLVALVSFLFFIKKEQRKKLIVITILFSILSMIIFTPVFLRWSERTLVVKGGQLILKKNISERLAQWEASIVQISKNPILGGGYYTYYYRNVHYQAYYGYVKYIEHAHNTYLRILIESGLLGFFALLFMIFVMYYYPYKLLKHNSSRELRLLTHITLTAFISFLFASMTDSLINVGSVFGPLLVLFGLTFKKAKLENIAV